MSHEGTRTFAQSLDLQTPLALQILANLALRSAKNDGGGLLYAALHENALGEAQCPSECCDVDMSFDTPDVGPSS